MAMKQWIEICTVAGCNPRQMELMEIYLVAGRILNDAVVRQRCEPFIVNNILPKGSVRRVVEAMSPTELQELRARVSR